ncbi:hypothetical protein DIPPA_17188 [Diplonema papillatum]|nr:hypothetical protein DIPPA_17188 [Diplonema papillatum]
MLIPIRHIAMASTAVCVVVAVCLTLGLSLASADDALDKTRDLQDGVLATCFEAGEENLVEATYSTLSTLSERVAVAIQRQLDEARRAQAELVNVASKVPPSQSHDLASYAHIAPVMASLWDARNISFLLFLTQPNVSNFGFLLVENSGAAAHNAEFGRHENSTSIIATKEAVNRTYAAGSYPGLIGTLDHGSGGFFEEAPCNPVELLVQWTGDTVSGACDFVVVPTAINLVQDGLAMPAGFAMWSQIYSYSTYTGVTVLGDFRSQNGGGDAGERVGLVAAGFDLKTVNTFLASIAGDDREAFRSRIFLTVGGAGDQAGLLLGVSHGESRYETYGQDPMYPLRNITLKSPLHCTNASDPTIRSVSRFLYAAKNASVDAAVDPFASASREVMTMALDNGTYYILITSMTDRFGLNWWLSNVVDEDSVLGSTRQRRIAAKASVRESNDDVSAQLVTDQTVLFVVVISATIGIMCVAYFSTAQVNRSLELLTQDLKELAELKLDSIDTSVTRNSYIREVHFIHESFLTVLSAMREYRQFMPQSLTDYRMSAADRHGGIPETSSSSSSTDTEVVPGSGSNVASNEPSSHFTTEESGSPITGVMSKGFSVHPALAVHLHRVKSTAHVSLECRDFARSCHEIRDPHSIAEFHSQWLQCCVADAKSSNGNVARFIADRVDVNFGCNAPCPSPGSKAGAYILKVKDRLQMCPTAFLMVSGAASGTSLVGNLGCEGIRAPSTLGRTFTTARLMLSLCDELGLDVVLDQKAADDCQGRFTLIPVDMVRLESGRKSMCFYLERKKNDVAAEWMYAMNTEDDKAYLAVWESVKIADVPGALELLDKLPKEDDIAQVIHTRLTAFQNALRLANIADPESVEYSWTSRNLFFPAPAEHLLRQMQGRVKRRVHELASPGYSARNLRNMFSPENAVVPYHNFFSAVEGKREFPNRFPGRPGERSPIFSLSPTTP